MIDIKRQNREALDWILNFADKRQAYINKCNDFTVLGAVKLDGMPHGTSPGNPCQNKGISLVEIEQMKKWIIVIESMEKTLSEKQTRYLQLRRDAEQNNKRDREPGRPGWVAYTQPRYADWFFHRYGCECVPTDKTMEVWMNKIIDVTVRIAIHDGCFRWNN